MADNSTDLKRSDYMIDKSQFLGLQHRDNPKKQKNSRLRFDEESKAGKQINGIMDSIYYAMDVSVNFS